MGKGKGITKLTLSSFRGATTPTEITFDDRKLIVMVFGENGTGKSTIVDAIDMVCNGSPGSLREKTSTNAKEHLPALGRSVADIAVTLTHGAATWTGRYSGKDVIVDGPAAAPEAPPPVAHILRRSQILRLVEAPPSERYTEMRRFIGVALVEKAEKALKDEGSAADDRLNEIITRSDEAKDALQRLWEAEGRPDAPTRDAEDWARGKSAADPRDLQMEIERLDTLLRLIDQASTARREAVEQEDGGREIGESLAKIEQEIAEVELHAEPGGASLSRLLRDARDLLVPSYTSDVCPLCRQPEDLENLRRNVAARLEVQARLQELLGRRDQAAQQKKYSEQQTAALRERWQRAARDLEDYAATLTMPGVLPTIAETLLREETIGPAAISSEAILDSLLGQRAALQNRLESVRRDEAQYNAVTQNLEQIVKGRRNQKEAQANFERFKEALRIVRERRLAYTQEILDRVTVECNRIYERIHPGEPIGLNRFYLNERQRASLLQDATFHGKKGVPPQAYFSESHLDTLGFALFMALARCFTGGAAVIVLDDVFTSVDSQHLERIMNVLTDEAEYFHQIIVTTHYRLWRDRYRYTQGGSVDLIELSDWTLMRGIRHRKTKIAVHELQELLDAEHLDRQAVASKAGILLEAMLDELTYRYRCRLPRQDNEYALGDLCGAVTALARKMIIERRQHAEEGTESSSVAPEEIPIDPLFKPIADTTFIRNVVGSHFNSLGADVSDRDVRKFGEDTVRFVSAIVCANDGCGQIPSSNQGTHFACRCRQTRMSPLSI